MKLKLKYLYFKFLGWRTPQGWKNLIRGKKCFNESEAIRELFSKQKQGGQMIDVGAHYGESFVYYLAKGWNVLAFEPDPSNAGKISGQICSKRLKLSPLAVSNCEKTDVPFYGSEESTGISSMVAFTKGHQEVGKIQTTTLRKVIEEEEITKVDFLKIDTEGYDLFVLQGFPWEELLPSVILCEFEDNKTRILGYSYRDLGDYLVEKGYDVYLSEWLPVIRYGQSHKWKSLNRYPCELSDEKGWGNFIAFNTNALGENESARLKRLLDAWVN